MDKHAMTTLHFRILAAWDGARRARAAVDSASDAMRLLDSDAVDNAREACDNLAADILQAISDKVIDALPNSGRLTFDLGWFLGERFIMMDRGMIYATTHARVQLLDETGDDDGEPVFVPFTADADAFVAAMAAIHSQVAP